MRNVVCGLLVLALLLGTAAAQDGVLSWVDFDVGAAPLRRALELDIASQETEQPLDWVELLALAATRTGGGQFPASQVDAAARDFQSGTSPQALLGSLYSYYEYYKQAYGAVLDGLVGHYAVQLPDETGQLTWKATYGLKAFSPIAEGFSYTHYQDFGNRRGYGFQRRHLGNDLMGASGTPVVAIEGGTVEALGWNQYGGWRIGIRSDDRLRYYYYAHLQKDNPYAEGLAEGKRVEAGEVIGYLGRTGYSTRENTENIQTPHLHLGLQLVFDESQKECNSEIWVDVYALVELLSTHRSTVARDPETGAWRRVYGYWDLDRAPLPAGA